ncbi:hypothetical protein ABT215_43905, partial [Streptomyces sp900105755]|uniref:hypothetical protein n=1 Tax=Streptomyces sp. 900105755 TaxID=3154389 RepID=UPI00332F5DFA
RAVWIDPLGAPKTLTSDTAPTIPPLHARAIVIAPDGRPVANALPRFHESSSATHSILDPVRDHRYGAVGGEVEVAQPLVLYGKVSIHRFSGSVLARHSSGAQVVGDTLMFWPGRDGILHASEQEGYQPVEHLIPEIVTPPLKAIPGDKGRVPESEGVNLLQRTWQSLAAPSVKPGTKIPLTQLLTTENGWEITDEGDGISVLAVNPDAGRHAYSQYTVGVPVDGLVNLFEMALSGLSASDFFEFFNAGRNFGLDMAANYVTRLSGHMVQPGEVHLLANVPGIQQILGYSWLVFNHVGAGPLYERFFQGIVTKNLLPAASRTPLHLIHQALDKDVKDFFAEHQGDFTERFISTLRKTFEAYERTREILKEEDLSPNLDIGVHTALNINEALNSALRGELNSSSSEKFTQSNLIGMDVDYPLDSNDGRITPPLVLIELRHFVPASHNFLEHGGFSSPEEVNLSFKKAADVARVSHQQAQALQRKLTSSDRLADQARRTLDVLSTWISLSDAAQQISVQHESGAVRQLLTAEEAEKIRGWVDSFAESGTVDPDLNHRLRRLAAATQNLKPLVEKDRSANSADPLARTTRAAEKLMGILSGHSNRDATTSIPESLEYGTTTDNPDVDLLDPHEFRRYTTAPSHLHWRGASRVKHIDESIRNLQRIPVENYSARHTGLKDLMDQVREYSDSTQNSGRRRGVDSLRSQIEHELRIYDSLIKADETSDQVERYQHVLNALDNVRQLKETTPAAAMKFRFLKLRADSKSW